jgi:hypothetical protein
MQLGIFYEYFLTVREVAIVKPDEDAQYLLLRPKEGSIKYGFCTVCPRRGVTRVQYRYSTSAVEEKNDDHN